MRSDIVKFILSSFTALLLHPIWPSTKASLTISCISPSSLYEWFTGIQYGDRVVLPVIPNWTSQVTYDAVAWPIHIKRAWNVKKMLLYYRNQLWWVTRSCWLPYSQREIRYGARVGSCRPSAVSDASSGHLRLRRCSDANTSKQCLSREKDASMLSWPTMMGH